MRQFKASVFPFLALALVLTGCAQSVVMVKPSPGSDQINPVPFGLRFHPRANQPTLRAVLQGPGVNQNISNSFSRVPNDPLELESAAPVPYLPPGNYTFRTEARMSPQQSFDVVGKSWNFHVPNRAIQITPVYDVTLGTASSGSSASAPGPSSASITPLPMDRIDVIVSNTRKGNLNLLKTSNRDVTVTLEPSNSNIAINGMAAGAAATVTIPANHLSAIFTVTGIQLGTSQITAKARDYGYHDSTIPVNIIL